MYIAKKYGCKVTAVEPSPRNFDLLKKNIAANGLEHLITPLNFAVTRDGRDVQIGDNPINWGGNNIYQGGVPAKSIRLADIIQSPVALLKMDCERAEFEILEDLTPLKWVKAIRGEFHGHEEGDIEALLARVQVVVRDARPTMHHSWALRNKQRQQKRK
jgi:FkbM family methyltransferase